MDFSDTPQEAEFRAQARAFLAQHWPALEPGERAYDGEMDEPERIRAAQAWQARKYDSGWACLTWPT